MIAQADDIAQNSVKYFMIADLISAAHHVCQVNNCLSKTGGCLHLYPFFVSAVYGCLVRLFFVHPLFTSYHKPTHQKHIHSELHGQEP